MQHGGNMAMDKNGTGRTRSPETRMRGRAACGRRIRLAALAGVAFLWTAAASLAATTYALCVGINRYSLSGCSTLHGCVNDATYFRDNLVARGSWIKSDTTLLTDSSATKTAVRNKMAYYASKAKSGDTFVFMQSSHGGRSSGTSVYLCLYNATYWDTELAADLAKFPSGTKVVVVVDACHSGGLFKGAKSKAAAPAFDLADRVSALMDATRQRRKARGEPVEKGLASSEIGWATAAEYNEYSLDGGYFDTDRWLSSYLASGSIQGSVFAASFLWSWWNGSCDTSSCGDGDGFADAYECGQRAYATCTSTYLWGSSAFTPQFRNTAVLRNWGVNALLPQR